MARTYEQRKAYMKAWRAKNNDRNVEYNKKWLLQNPERAAIYKEAAVWWRRKYTLKKYGLTLEQFEQMFVDQRGLCAGCSEARPLVVDHCHATGKVRALLCRSCNRSLGFARDDPTLMRALAAYVERHSETWVGDDSEERERED